MSAAAGVALDSVERLKEVALRAALKDSLLDAPRLAIIAPQDSVFGIARMYEAYRRGAGGTKDVGVFRRADEAAQYLGIPAEALQGDPPRDS